MRRIAAGCAVGEQHLGLPRDSHQQRQCFRALVVRAASQGERQAQPGRLGGLTGRRAGQRGQGQRAGTKPTRGWDCQQDEPWKKSEPQRSSSRGLQLQLAPRAQVQAEWRLQQQLQCVRQWSVLWCVHR